MSHPGLEYWKTPGILIVYLKGKEIKGINIRKRKFCKVVMFCKYNYYTNKETRNIVRCLVATLGGTLLKCSSKTQRKTMISITEDEYIALLEFA